MAKGSLIRGRKVPQWRLEQHGECGQHPNPEYKSEEDGGSMEVERAEQPGGEYNEHVEEASEMAANARRAALSMFPDKELAYDILYRPRLQRLMNERFRLQ